MASTAHEIATNRARRLDTIPDALSKDLLERMGEDRARGWKNPFRTDDAQALRREQRDEDRANLWRPAFVRDVEKIMYTPAYNRYAGKTQVFSFRSNDDLSRRGLHVQLVARVARDIGRALGLNCDLIEAIGLGHDLGHTPFGHAGERCLNEVFHARTGRWFLHNVHSVRVLDTLYGRNITLQTLDGALCHNGEYEQRVFELSGLKDFAEFDRVIESCYTDGGKTVGALRPMTLEGCVVRIADIIAYVGRDRQDAIAAGLLVDEDFDEGWGGSYNSWILSHATCDIIEHSYGKDRIEMSEELFAEISRAKAENYRKIYRSSAVECERDEVLQRAFDCMYERCLADVHSGDESSYIFKHHIVRLNQALSHYDKRYDWQSDPEQTVVDYIASMTDGYFTELATKLFPDIRFPQRTYINERAYCDHEVY